MIWRPDTSDRVVDGLHWLGLGPELLAVGISQENRLLQNRVWLKVTHANGLLTPVDVCALNDWVLIRAWGDGDFDGWVGFGELWQGVADKQADVVLDIVSWSAQLGLYALLHALGATGPIAVVKVELLALENECANAVLYCRLAFSLGS